MDFKKRTKVASTSITILVISILIGFSIAYLSVRHYVRIDITEDKQYTLSEVSKDILTNLDDRIIVKVFFSKELPPNMHPFTTSVNDLLDEMKAYSNGNIEIQYLDPSKEDVKQDAAGYGIPEIQMNVLQKDKYEVQKGYLGMAMLYEDKYEIIPVLSNSANLEYDLMANIQKLRADSVKVVGFLKGHGEHSINEGDERADYLGVKSILEKNYELKTVDIASGQPIEGVDTLIVAGPTSEFSERDLYEIDQFIINGGNVIFLLDGANIDMDMNVTPASPGLDPLLAHYGLKLNPDLVTDFLSHANAPFSQGYFSFVVPYPYWIQAIKDNFNPDSSVMAPLESLTLIWASSIETLPVENLETNILAYTTDQATSNNYPFNLNPDQDFNKTDMKQRGLVAMSKGAFHSYFADKEIPPVVNPAESVDENGEPIDVAPAVDIDTESELNRETKSDRDSEGAILLVGDSDFATDQFLNQFNNNVIFIESMVDSLTVDQSLLEITVKKIKDRPLNQNASDYQTVTKFLVTFFIPLLVAAFGIIRSQARKKKRNQRY